LNLDLGPLSPGTSSTTVQEDEETENSCEPEVDAENVCCEQEVDAENLSCEQEVDAENLSIWC
jgi:hypothetical protein